MNTQRLDDFIGHFEVAVNNLDGSIKDAGNGMAPSQTDLDTNSENQARLGPAPPGFARSRKAIDTFFDNYSAALDDGRDSTDLEQTRRTLVNVVVFEVRACNAIISDAKEASLPSDYRANLIKDVSEVRDGLLHDYPSIAPLVGLKVRD